MPALIALAVVACHRPTPPTGPSPIASVPTVAAPSAPPSADASAPLPACRDGLTLPLPAAATALAVGGTTLYWVDEGADRNNTVRVWGMSVRDGLPQLLATEHGAFGGLIADGSTAYVAIRHALTILYRAGPKPGEPEIPHIVIEPTIPPDGRIIAVTLGGAKREVLGGLYCVEGLTQDAHDLFWDDVTGVFEMDKAGGAPRVVARLRGYNHQRCSVQNHMAQILVDDRDVFRGYEGGVVGIPRPGGDVDLTGAASANRWPDIRLPGRTAPIGQDATNLYFAAAAGVSDGGVVPALWRVAKSGGAPTVVAKDVELSPAVDGRVACWGTRAGSDIQVHCLALPAAEDAHDDVIATRSADYLYTIAIDDRCVYFATGRDERGARELHVVRAGRK